MSERRPKKRLLAGLAVVAGLGVGGLAGVILGVPTIAAAQTTTTEPPAGTPATPAAPDAPATPVRPPHDDANCPNMGGESDGSGSSTSGTSADAAVYRHHPGGVVPGGATTSL